MNGRQIFLSGAALVLSLAVVPGAAAQNLILKDGRTIATKSMRRQGQQIITTVELPGAEPGKPAQTGDFGYALTQIERIDYPRPAVLDQARALLAANKAEELLTRLEPVVTFYLPFGSAPGSLWAEAALFKVQALVALGREAEAVSVADQLARDAGDPETARAAQMEIALVSARKGIDPRMLALAELARKESKRSATLAGASYLIGLSLLEKKEWEEALLAFLRLPVFYPQEKNLQPRAALGAGRAYFAIEDFAAAKAAFNQVIATPGAQAEAELAKAELERVARREKALAPPK